MRDAVYGFAAGVVLIAEVLSITRHDTTMIILQGLNFGTLAVAWWRWR